MKKSILLSSIMGLAMLISSGVWAGAPKCHLLNTGELPVYIEGKGGGAL